MKPALIVLTLAALCLTVVYGLPQYRLKQEKARRAFNAANSLPLVLDPKTQAILSGADRVETFRLAGGGDEDYTKEEQTAIHEPHPHYFENYPVIDAGQVLRQSICRISAKSSIAGVRRSGRRSVL